MKKIVSHPAFLITTAIVTLLGNTDKTIGFFERFTGTINMKDWIIFIKDLAGFLMPFVFASVCYLVYKLQKAQEEYKNIRDKDIEVHNKNASYINEELIALKVFNQLFLENAASVTTLEGNRVSGFDEKFPKLKARAKDKLIFIFKQTRTLPEIDEILERAIRINAEMPNPKK